MNTSVRMIYQTENTRSIILNAARKVFFQNGFIETQMTDIAAEAHISRTSLYRYFQDKTDLAMALSDSIVRKMAADSKAWISSFGTPGRNEDWLDSLNRYIKEHLLSKGHCEECFFIAEVDVLRSCERRSADPQYGEWRLICDDTDIGVETCIAHAAREGSLRPGLDARLTTIMIMRAMQSLQQSFSPSSRGPYGKKPKEMGKIQDELVDVLIEGLRDRESR
jgi:Transcriptional regulator